MFEKKWFVFVKMVKDIVFPVFCLSCQTEGSWLCPLCLEKLKSEIKPQFFCPHCYQDNQDGRTCLACRPFSFLDGAFSLSSYSNETIAKMVQLLKYDYVEEMGEVFEKLIEEFVDRLMEPLRSCHSRESGNPATKSDFHYDWIPAFAGMTVAEQSEDKVSPRFKNLIPAPARNQNSEIHNSEFVILPVPLHRRRYLERGFNQAEIIAQAWSKHLSLPMLKNVLIRSRPTQTQVGLGRAERQKNLVGAFKLSQPLESPGVILIDDVFTTGSTLQECARVLKEGGAREVWGVTIAREI